MLDRTFSFFLMGYVYFPGQPISAVVWNSTCTVKLREFVIFSEMSLSNSNMIHQPNSDSSLQMSEKDPFNRKSYLSNELGLSQLHHYVGPDNVPELRAVHRDAYPTAIFYLATILGLYLLGLLTILIHYMNSSYGKWAWTLSDVWDEIRYFTSFLAYIYEHYGRLFSPISFTICFVSLTFALLLLHSFFVSYSDPHSGAEHVAKPRALQSQDTKKMKSATTRKNVRWLKRECEKCPT